MYNKNSSIIQQMFTTNGKIEKIVGNLNRSKDALVKNDFSSFEKSFSRVCLDLETVTLASRNIANSVFKLNNCPKKFNNLRNDIAREVYKFEINPFEFGYRISLPCTLSHYGDVKKSILEAPLNTALRNYQNNNSKLPTYNKVFFIVVNHLNRETKSLYIRDNDNYDYKQIVNTLSFWFLPDDSPKHCNMINTTKLDERNYTEVFIVPTDDFVAFYKKYSDCIC